jgi:hypothetical protein
MNDFEKKEYLTIIIIIFLKKHSLNGKKSPQIFFLIFSDLTCKCVIGFSSFVKMIEMDHYFQCLVYPYTGTK